MRRPTNQSAHAELMQQGSPNTSNFVAWFTPNEKQAMVLFLALIVRINMDVLSEILAMSHVRSSVLSEIECRGEWAIDMLDRGAVASLRVHAVPFHYVLEGNCYLTDYKEYTPLRAGNLVVAPAWPPHAVVSAPGIAATKITDIISSNGLEIWDGSTFSRPVRFVAGEGDQTTRLLSGVLTIEGHAADMLMGQLPEMLTLSLGSDTLDGQFATALSFIRQEQAIARPGYVAVAERLTDLMFIQIIRACIEVADLKSGLLAALANRNVSLALAAIHADPSQNWTVASLARHVGLSRTVFAERFRALVGITPIQYVTRWRMVLAEDLLLRTDLPIGEVQLRTGFSSSFAFARAFKLNFGQSPRGYRQSRRG